MQSDYGPLGPGIDREHRDEAKVVLDDLRHWRMPPEAWHEVEGLVNDLVAAMTSGDQATVRRMTVALELLSDERVGRVGDPADGPPPKVLMDLSVRLVHSLDEDAGDDEGETPKRR
ncbi:CATRA system-associated protein [Actinoallomurus bryophytorum]|nr:CATRA system-associated protein [Actinoallomurus bryophytorum]